MEQALVFVSIILGVGVAFELENLNRVIRSDKVKWHWAQPIYALYVLMAILSYWWMVASRADQQIALGDFLPVMFSLIILTLMAAASLPEKIPEDGLSLADYYQENRRYMWGLWLLYFVPLSVNWLMILDSHGKGLWYVLSNGWLEFVPIAAATWLVFAKKWWKVALGLAVLSITPLAWLGRTL